MKMDFNYEKERLKEKYESVRDKAKELKGEYSESISKEYKEYGKYLVISVVVLILLLLFGRILPSLYTTLDGIPSTYTIQEFESSKKTSTVEPEATHTYTLASSLDFNELDFKIFSDAAKPVMTIEIKNIDTGKVVNHKPSSLGYYVVTEAGKARIVHIAANAYNVKDNFSSGRYKISITNNSDAAFDIALTNNNSISFRTAYSTKIGGFIFVISLLLIVLFLVAGILIIFKFYDSIGTKLRFIMFFIPLALLYFILTPAWSFPDADYHYAATYNYSNVILFRGKEDSTLFSPKDGTFVNSYFPKSDADPVNPQLAAYELSHTSFGFKSENKLEEPSVRANAGYGEKGFYSFISYLPQTLGLTLGRILGVSPVMAITLARFFALIAYFLGVLIAIALTPVGKKAFSLIALFPMALSLSSSLSCDLMLFIVALNFIAALLRLRAIYSGGSSSGIPCALLLILNTFMLGSIKGGAMLILLPLVCMVFAGGDKKQSILTTIFVTLAGVGGLILFDYILPSVDVFQVTAEKGMLGTSYFWTNPGGYLGKAFSTVFGHLKTFFYQAMGTHLGNFEEVLDMGTLKWLFIATLLIVFAEEDDDDLNSHKSVQIIALVVILLFNLLMPSMLLKSTPKLSKTITGIQGRIFLPLFPLILLIICKFRIRAFLHKKVKKSKVYDGMERLGLFIFGSASVFCVLDMMSKYLTR